MVHLLGRVRFAKTATKWAMPVSFEKWAPGFLIFDGPPNIHIDSFLLESFFAAVAVSGVEHHLVAISHSGFINGSASGRLPSWFNVLRLWLELISRDSKQIEDFAAREECKKPMRNKLEDPYRIANMGPSKSRGRRFLLIA